MAGKFGATLKSILRAYARRSIFEELERSAWCKMEYEGIEMPPEEELRRRAAAIEAGCHQECFPDTPPTDISYYS